MYKGINYGWSPYWKVPEKIYSFLPFSQNPVVIQKMDPTDSEESQQNEMSPFVAQPAIDGDSRNVVNAPKNVANALDAELRQAEERAEAKEEHDRQLVAKYTKKLEEPDIDGEECPKGEENCPEGIDEDLRRAEAEAKAKEERFIIPVRGMKSDIEL